MTSLQALGLAYRKAKVDLHYSSHASLDAIADYDAKPPALNQCTWQADRRAALITLKPSQNPWNLKRKIGNAVS